jgi:hypothetical protein
MDKFSAFPTYPHFGCPDVKKGKKSKITIGHLEKNINYLHPTFLHI